MKLFGPDCLWTTDQLSGSSLLYFHDERILFTLHPSVTSHLTGENPFAFLPFLDQRSPAWKQSFERFLSTWDTFRSSAEKTRELIDPLRGVAFNTVLLSYNRGSVGMQTADEIVKSSSLDEREIWPLIDPYHASDELFSHIFFEKLLEVKYGNLSPDELMSLGKEKANIGFPGQDTETDFDWSPIYEYCEYLFTSFSLEELLTRVYMFRLPIVQQSGAVLLSNPGLITFLTSLPVSTDSASGDDAGLDADVIAWEIFRQILSPVVDPLNEATVRDLDVIIRTRPQEISRLKNRCYQLCANLTQETSMSHLSNHVTSVVKAEVQNELQDLLRIDQKALVNLLTTVFSDEKSWLAISSFIAGLASGQQIITSGAALYGLSYFGSRAFKEAADRRQKLATSAYTLIYRMTAGKRNSV